MMMLMNEDKRYILQDVQRTSVYYILLSCVSSGTAAARVLCSSIASVRIHVTSFVFLHEVALCRILDWRCFSTIGIQVQSSAGCVR